MTKEGKFGTQEAVFLVTVTISTKIFFTSPAFLTRFVGTAVWYTTLISAAAAILAFTFVLILLKRFPGKNLMEIFDLSLGRFFGFIFSFAFATLFIQDAGSFLREFTDVIKTYTFPDTPPIIIAGVFAAVVGMAALQGLESIARVSKLLGYVLLLAYILVIMLSVKSYHFKYVFPILGYGIESTAIHGLLRSSVYGEVLMLAIFAGSLHGINSIRKVGYVSIALSGLLLATGLLSFIMVFPYPVLSELTAPMYAMTRLIKYGTFFTRIDPLLLVLWDISSFIAISALFYTAVSVYCKAFRLQDERPVLVPGIIILLSLALAPREFSDIVYGSIQQLREYSWIIFFILPVIALISAALRKKKGGGSNA